MQRAIADLLGKNLPSGCELGETDDEVIKAQIKAREQLKLVDAKVGVLSLLFDRIHLPKGTVQEKNHFVPLQAIAPSADSEYPKIPYPVDAKKAELDLKKYREDIAKELNPHLAKNWHDLNFLSFVLEKYGSCVSYGDSHTALVDAARMTAAVAEALIQNKESNSNKLHLIVGSLSGIQNFIYTISSDGALKSLRARSFYLEMVVEEIVQQLLKELNLPRTNVIYAGGGNISILAGGCAGKLEKQLETFQNSFNEWLEKKFQGKIFFSLSYEFCNPEDVGSSEFRECWDGAIAELAKQKNQKFLSQIQQGDLLATRDSYPPCKVCHRDDTQELKPLNKIEPDSPLACKTCRQMFKLGDELPKTLVILRTSKSDSKSDSKSIEICGSHYYLFPNKQAITLSLTAGIDTVYCINNWDIDHYTGGMTLTMLMGRYYQRQLKKENEPNTGNQFIRAEDLAEVAQGIDRVGYLRMDVDQLGQIFAKGLDDQNYSLPRVASLSRQMSYFFKVYLNSLADDRFHNLPPEVKTLTTPIDAKDENTDKKVGQFSRKNLMFIYAGGDDLFISGAWNEIIEFALDIYQSFRAYSGNNPDITISGGISIKGAKFPLYQAADSSGDAEGKAKDNGRDSLGLFGKAFKWEEWLGYEGIEPQKINALKKEIKQINDPKIKLIDYIDRHDSLDLFGVFPITKAILELLKSEAQASRNFTRNLLATAQIQEQKIKELEDKPSIKQYDKQKEDIRYFLHLPKIAYTLARLPSQVQNNGSFSSISQSLKSPYNAPYFRAIATWIELLNRGE